MCSVCIWRTHLAVHSLQKSVHLPLRSQSPNRVGSGKRPPRRGPPHSSDWCSNDEWASTNISSCSISISSSSSSIVPHALNWTLSSLLFVICCDTLLLLSLVLLPFVDHKNAILRFQRKGGHGLKKKSKDKKKYDSGPKSFQKTTT